MFNKEILEKISKTNSKLILVTKYFDKEKTQEIFSKIKKKSFFLALGENRIDDILKKEIPRNFVHFIGNIQSKKIKKINDNCSVIHSLCNLNHAKIFAEQKNKCQFFIQINISGEPQKQGVLPQDFAKFYKSLPKKLEVIGISGIGKGKNFTQEEKIKEFKTLLELRKKFNLKWKISAGTSTDYEIALKMKIDIIRIGKALFS